MTTLPALAWVVFAIACDRGGSAPPSTIDLSREHDSAITIEGVRFVSVFMLDANEQSPLLVMLHGRGDTAENFREMWTDIPIKLQLSIPRAPLPFHTGRQWFAWPPGTTEEALAAGVSVAEEKLWPAIRGLAKGRKVMIGGFSQGALVAYAMAARHPDEVTCAFLIGGRIPKLETKRTAPIFAFHGTADQVISIDDMRAGIAALVASGADAQLQEYPGVGHQITRAMLDDIVDRVRAQLRR
jgi:phospholipase/carboxylesterase